jgi:hypothetical protein
MTPIMALWLALASGSNAPAAAVDPLAPAWAGQVQCYGPNVERRSCVSIGAYAKDADGAIQNTATVLLAVQPLIVMRTTAAVQVKGEAVCAVLAIRDIETAEFTVDGQPAAPDNAASIRRGIAPAYKQVLDRELCTTYEPDGEDTKALVTVDGRRRPDLDLRVRWVAPGEGFEVKP